MTQTGRRGSLIGAFPNRSFDIEFWQEQGDEAIFSATPANAGLENGTTPTDNG